VGCRRVADPHDLVRIARAPDDTVSVGAAPGRGAWLCASTTAGCFEQAVGRRVLEQALRTRLSAAELASLRAKLLEPLKNGGERE
jgi:predicted RNA-binding protein YlxR (DUF448 family)